VSGTGRKWRGAWRAVAWSAAVAVLGLSLAPLDVPPALSPTNADKLAHATLHGGLMFCFARGYARRAWPFIALALVAYGGLIELLQGLTPTRMASVPDALANSLGISIMLALEWRRPPASVPLTAGESDIPHGHG
jgi:VanZ family protein